MNIDKNNLSYDLSLMANIDGLINKVMPQKKVHNIYIIIGKKIIKWKSQCIHLNYWSVLISKSKQKNNLDVWCKHVFTFYKYRRQSALRAATKYH